MSVETVLLDFQVPPSMDDAVYVRDVATVATCVAEALRQDCLEQGCISSAFSYAPIYSGPKDCMFTIKHYFREGLITLTLEYFKVTSYNVPERRRNIKRVIADQQRGFPDVRLRSYREDGEADQEESGHQPGLQFASNQEMSS